MVTTDSGHNLPVYPNLARDIMPKAVNQLWIADITYSLRAEFVYLAVVLDAFSRRGGRACGRTLEAKLAVSALRMAMISGNRRQLVHHSDRGVRICATTAF